jgi:release factor glutamine methyltransferase
LDAECILSHILHISRSHLLAHGERELTPAHEAAFFAAAARRNTGLPIAYITGAKEFFGADYLVTPDVLIPKPDTELLVEKTLEAIERLESGGGKPSPCGALRCADTPICGGTPPATPPVTDADINNFLHIADVCTGSSCIAISLIRGSARAIHVTALDISPAALAVAKQNAARLLSAEQQRRVTFAESDLLSAHEQIPATPAQYDIIVSNPPYIPDAEAEQLLYDGRDEPFLALAGGHDGLSVTKRLIAQAAEHLAPGGMLLLEIDERAAEAVSTYASQHGFTQIAVYADLAGKPRVVAAVKAIPCLPQQF